MKVLIIHTLYQIKDGEDRRVENEAYQLREKGFKVKILYFSNGGGYMKSLIKFLFLPFNLFSYFKVNRVLKNFQPDIVHIHNWHYAASPSVIQAIRKNNLPVVLSIHNFRLLCPSGTLFFKNSLFLSSLNVSFPWNAIRNGVYRNSILLSFWLAFTVYFHEKIGSWKYISKYIVFTDFIKDLFLNSRLNLACDQVIIKPNSAAPILDFQPRERKDFFLFVGRLNEEKGIKILLSAFSDLRYELIIIGDGPLKNLVEKYSKKHPNIIFKGLLSNQEVKVYMSAASSLIFPSIWFEGMPMTIVESFSVSTPVIGSRIGAMEYMIKNNINGLHFEVGNVNDLRNKIKFMNDLPVEEKEKYRNAAKNSYQENYTPEKNVNGLISEYNKIITSKKN